MSQRPRRPGFTLVELLVVIGIIALLIGILLPSLAKARRSARTVACAAAVRELGNVSLGFAAERQGNVPIGGRIWGYTLTPADTPRWMPTFDDGTDGLRPMPLPAALADYLGIDLGDGTRAELVEALTDRDRMRPFACPDDDAEVTTAFLTDGDNAWLAPEATVSYGFNEAVTGLELPFRQIPRALGKISRVGGASETVFLADATSSEAAPLDLRFPVFFNYTAQTTLADCRDGTAGGDARTFDFARHGGRMNVLFLDGHAAASEVEGDELAQIYLARGITGP